MRRAVFAAPLALALVALFGAPAFAQSAVGDRAPEMEPQGWINNMGPISWKSLQGKVILIEKWATW